MDSPPLPVFPPAFPTVLRRDPNQLFFSYLGGDVEDPSSSKRRD